MASRRHTADPTTDGWHRFTGPYPVVLMDRGLEVEPGQAVHHDRPPAGDWEPCAAPDTDDPADGDAPEES